MTYFSFDADRPMPVVPYIYNIRYFGIVINLLPFKSPWQSTFFLFLFFTKKIQSQFVANSCNVNSVKLELLDTVMRGASLLFFESDSIAWHKNVLLMTGCPTYV